MCILFITLITKTKGMREGASEHSSDLKKLYRAGTVPPGSYISGSATDHENVNAHENVLNNRFLKTIP